MRLLFAALALIVGTMPGGGPVAGPSLAGHSAHRRREAEPHRTRAARARRQAGFDGNVERADSRSSRSTPPTRSRGSTISSVSVSGSTTRGVPRISACRAGPRPTVRRVEAHPPDADRHRDPERGPHVSRDPHGWPRAGGEPRAKLDGILGGALGGRHADRREQRIQRQDVAEPLRPVAYGGAAGDESGTGAADFGHLRGGGDLHRSARVREALGLHGGDGARPPIRKCSSRSANAAATSGRQPRGCRRARR